MKKFLLYTLIYGISLVLSLKIGGVYLSEASFTPLFMTIGSVIMILIFHSQDAPDTMNYPESNDVILTYEEKRTMLLSSAKTLSASVPLEILLIFTWHSIPKTLFSILVFILGWGIGLYLGRRKIHDSVHTRMHMQDKEE